MLAVLFSSINSFETIDDPCYDRQTGIAQRCIPQFENVAYNKQVWSSSQCGSQSPMNYCIEPFNLNTKQTTTRSVKHCDRCDSTIPESIRDTRYLTDLEESNSTCWVSAPVYEPTQQSNITLQISFGKKYELTYISLQFCTALKPDSLTVLKSMDYGKTWIPFQYYSSDCKKVFNRQLKVKISQANEQEAVCTDQHLQSSPFSTNRIGFSTLEGRPSFHEFDTSPVLQDWVTATDIRVVFNRLLSPSLLLQNNNNNNSADRHIRSNSRHLRSQQLQMQIQNLGYYYAAVSELAIGGRCKCNGHASRCLLNKLVFIICFKIIIICGLDYY
jgi:netrin 1